MATISYSCLIHHVRPRHTHLTLEGISALQSHHRSNRLRGCAPTYSSAAVRCRQRRCLSVLARIQEINCHQYDQRRQLPLCLSPSAHRMYSLPRRSSPSLTMSGDSRMASTVFAGGYSPMNQWNFGLRSFSFTIDVFTGWKYSYRSGDRRRFASDANVSTTKPNPIQTEEDATNAHEATATEPILKVVIDTIKSKVESETDPIQEKSYSTAHKTQDDFADYLKGEEVVLDDDTGLIVKNRNFALNELNRKNKSTSLAESDELLLQPLSSISGGKADDSTVGETSPNESSTATMQPNDANDTPQSTISEYKFSPNDATLSGRERYELRRRAIEEKLELQQAKSRATTTSNVQRALAGNFIIAAAKLAAAMSSGSSAMLSEFVHSVVDCGNQALLLVGLSTSHQAADRSHPYGYGKAIYFWALVSALGTFFLGAGVSMTHAVGELMNPSMTTEVPMEVWGVLGMSFAVDGYVFGKTVQGVKASMRIDGDGGSFWKYATTKVRDPATLAVLLEDGAACLGVVLAIGGIGMTQYTGMPVFDGLAGMGISALLGVMGMALVSVNHRFLIGQGLDKATREDIEKIILSRRSIDNVYSVQSQWTGPDTFSYKAEVDFDGTFLAAKLMPRYQQEFFDAKHTLDRDLRVLLSWYAEDVMRAAEREVRHIEEEIRLKYPSAQYIELEPMSKDADRYAIDDGMEAQLRRVEIEVLNRYLKSLYKIKEEK
eukprot:scaffold1618_cov196-Alexandrium_tamarense.AAC.12